MVKKKLEKEETYKLIFMDFEMPGLDGFSTANQIIKCLDSQKDQTNIIGCTGYSKISLDKSAFCEILEKPVTKKKI
jgi:CheY-like chemotaxis protein